MSLKKKIMPYIHLAEFLALWLILLIIKIVSYPVRLIKKVLRK